MRASRYWRQWLITAAILGLFLAGLWHLRLSLTPSPSVPSGDSRRVFWYFLIQLPHITDARRAADYPLWLEERLTAMRETGFQPMRWSQILDRLQRNEGLPPQTVGLFYEQGYRSTLNAAAPVFEKLNFPVTLIASEEPFAKGDWGHISRYRAYQLRKSGLWDIGLFRGSVPGRVILQTPDDRRIRIGPGDGRPLWTDPLDDHALNRGLPDQFHRLFFHPSWRVGELSARMLAEAPVDQRCWLSVRSIQGRLFGVTLDQSLPAPPGFRLQAAPSQRTASTFWLGTRGLNDLELDVRAEKVFGELWILLRSELSGSGVRIGVLPHQLVAEIPSPGGFSRIASVPRARPAGDARVQIRLEGPMLTVLQAQGDALRARVPETTRRPDGLVQIMLYDRLHGAAMADGIRLTLTPRP